MKTKPGVKKQKLKKLTGKEKAVIKAETRKEFKHLSTLPPPPYKKIRPATGVRKMNPSSLCIYVSDKLARIASISAFDRCSALQGTCTALYEALLPLAGADRKDLISAERTQMKTYTKQLKANFNNLVLMCATISNGNFPLFSLTGVQNQKKSIKNTKKLNAVVFQLNHSKGRGRIGVSCPKMKYATSYTVYYGPGEYDKITWNHKNGTSRIVIENLIPGDYINFIMVARGATGEGKWSNPQGIHVPFN